MSLRSDVTNMNDYEVGTESIYSGLLVISLIVEVGIKFRV